LLANFNRKEHLRHRAVSLRQHGFLVAIPVNWLSPADTHARCYVDRVTLIIAVVLPYLMPSCYRPTL